MTNSFSIRTDGVDTVRISPQGTNSNIIRPRGPQIVTLLRETWDTQLGTSDTALLGTAFDSTTSNTAPPDVLEVITNSGLGWSRTNNVLRSTMYGEASGLVIKDNVFASGTSHYGRVYLRSDEETWGNNHPLKYGSGLLPNAITLVPWARYPNGTNNLFTLRAYYREDGSDNAYPYLSWSAGNTGYNLDFGTWYRYEWYLEYKSPIAYRIYPRLYTLGGILLFDVNSYYAADQPSYTLQDHYDNGFWFGVNPLYPDSMEQFALGNEGPATTTATLGSYYFADLWLRTGDWIGDAS